jgi:organic hydroperoxide reductase OsmC/OhrA
MHPFPHRYHVAASGGESGSVRVSAQGLPELQTSAPPEFDGPEGYWSPETLLAAAVADCYVLSFRAVARASRLQWQSLEVDVEGVLDKVDGVSRFTHFKLTPRVCIADAEGETLAHSVLAKAKKVCLVTNSLNAECELAPVVLTGCTA